MLMWAEQIFMGLLFIPETLSLMRGVGGPRPLGPGVRPGLELRPCHVPPRPRGFLPSELREQCSVAPQVSVKRGL